MQQVTIPQKWRFTGISLAPPPPPPFYVASTPMTCRHQFAEICLCRVFAFMHYSGDWQAIEGALSHVTVAVYLQTWWLKLNWSKLVLAAFHLNNREAGRKFNISLDGKCLSFTQIPAHLGVKLDKSLTYRRHLDSLRGWEANAAVLQTAALALVYFTAKYCAPVWCRSVHTHIIDMAINDTLRVVTGCLCPTPLDNLPIFAGIQPAELLQRQAMLSLSYRALVPGHLLYHKLADPAKQPQQLKSRHPFVPAAKQFLRTIEEQNINVTGWVDHAWSAEWSNSASRLCSFIPDAGPHPQELALPRPAWTMLNHL